MIDEVQVASSPALPAWRGPRKHLRISLALWIGALMLGYGGGGHHAAGTCQIPHERTVPVLDEIAEAVNRTRSAAPERA